MIRLLVVIAAAAALVGCGTAGDRDEARGVVERFYDAVRQDDGQAACALLAEPTVTALEGQSGQACPEAVTRLEYEGGAVVAAQVFITNARVELRGGESAFLARGPAGWLITAVACKPEQGPPAEIPMDCEVEA